MHRAFSRARIIAQASSRFKVIFSTPHPLPISFSRSHSHSNSSATNSALGAQSTMTTPPSTSESTTSDLSTLSHSDLISRITNLESLLPEQTTQLAALTSQATTPPSPQLPSSNSKRSTRKPKPFDPSLYSTRHIALKFSYLGSRYNGFEHANGSVPPKPTIEEVLWKALRKARLISPPLEKGMDEGFDVVWDTKDRERIYGKGNWLLNGSANGKMRLEINWDGCQYSKCGRTDKGVSAFGQVVGIRVRSNRPLKKNVKAVLNNGVTSSDTPDVAPNEAHEDEIPAIEVDDLASETYEPSFDPIKDELPYMSILNSILPPDIRVLAWCPDPPSDFDARFSCRERRYKYFFTNPAFCPTPGPRGMTFANNKPSRLREGWLDIEKMRQAAKKLEGLHDFRNLCKIDPSKQMPNCERRITLADVQEWDSSGNDFQTDPHLSSGESNGFIDRILPISTGGAVQKGPKTYTFAVHGSAFLWHQVRCMAAIVFLVGQGLEEPSVVDQLLDVKRNPCRPTYEMAEDTPLVLWDCVFPNDNSRGEDALHWIYAGDEQMLPALTTKGDDKFGPGGVVDELWSMWRKAKMDEILAASLLDLALEQGDGSALRRGGQRESRLLPPRSQKIFDGSETPRLIGEYTRVIDKPKLETLEAQNLKYASGKMARREAKKAQIVE